MRQLSSVGDSSSLTRKCSLPVLPVSRKCSLPVLPVSRKCSLPVLLSYRSLTREQAAGRGEGR